MADGLVQVPPDSTGKKVDTTELTVGANTVERQRINLADPVGATALAPVTSSYGLGVSVGNTVAIVSASSGLVQISGTVTVTATAATNPWATAPSFSLPIVSASSGLIQISGTPTVTATAATNPWSSAPGFNLPIVSASSGLVQISGTATVDSRRGQTLLFASLSASSSGAVSLVAADASNKIKVTSYVLVSSGAVNIFFQSSNTSLSGVMPLAANEGISVHGDMTSWCLETSVNGNLAINLSAAVAIGGHLSYFKEP